MKLNKKSDFPLPVDDMTRYRFIFSPLSVHFQSVIGSFSVRYRFIFSPLSVRYRFVRGR
jgi:hypothetical protein